jgi:hypothetical protein
MTSYQHTEYFGKRAWKVGNINSRTRKNPQKGWRVCGHGISSLLHFLRPTRWSIKTFADLRHVICRLIYTTKGICTAFQSIKASQFSTFSLFPRPSSLLIHLNPQFQLPLFIIHSNVRKNAGHNPHILSSTRRFHRENITAPPRSSTPVLKSAKG